MSERSFVIFLDSAFRALVSLPSGPPLSGISKGPRSVVFVEALVSPRFTKPCSWSSQILSVRFAALLDSAMLARDDWAALLARPRRVGSVFLALCGLVGMVLPLCLLNGFQSRAKAALPILVNGSCIVSLPMDPAPMDCISQSLAPFYTILVGDIIHCSGGVIDEANANLDVAYCLVFGAYLLMLKAEGLLASL
ncbi:hypothetical protein Nepgr_033663 [Nepenthes gracilis]|uniref:Uncharacterized protein n=1 Tax=Nepenthes gracilis TaxID=150966 RepID=A0AAD3TMG6_NEPGR|nr:hypothetical protein Nepgr_033663 [Nepenthes gracilis]